MAFKMKGNPFQRNFGIGSPAKQKTDLTKKQTGPKAEVKKDTEDYDATPLSPGYEDPVKIQKLQREGLTPDSQKFHDKAWLKSQREEEVRREDLDEKGKAIWDAHRKKSPAKQVKSPDEKPKKPKKDVDPNKDKGKGRIPIREKKWHPGPKPTSKEEIEGYKRIKKRIKSPNKMAAMAAGAAGGGAAAGGAAGGAGGMGGMMGGMSKGGGGKKEKKKDAGVDAIDTTLGNLQISLLI